MGVKSLRSKSGFSWTYETGGGKGGLDPICARLERPNLVARDEAACKLARQSDGCVQGFALAVILHLDSAFGMWISGCERRQVAQVRSDPDRGKAGAGRLDACYQR